MLQRGAKGPPVVPTAPPGDCSNRAASTEFVCEAVAGATGGIGPTGAAGDPGDPGAAGATGASGTSIAVLLTAADFNTVSSASTTYVMAGFGTLITPPRTGNWVLFFAGMLKNSVAGDGADIIVYKGTGTPPVAGAAVPGSATAVSSAQRFITADAAAQSGFALLGHFAATSGVQFWLDIAYKAVTGGTVTLGGGTTNGIQSLLLDLGN